jgi:4-diphosphocytidyl-2-C-methyl-D-erythritol kinase
MEGYGERIEPIDPLGGFSVAVAVPSFELSTPQVYRRWDEMGYPVGGEFPRRALPPALRTLDHVRNDLQPAALAVAPELGDWMLELADRWDRPVMVSGSGPAVFGYFADDDEAASAAAAVPPGARGAVGCGLRPLGVQRVDA